MTRQIAHDALDTLFAGVTAIDMTRETRDVKRERVIDVKPEPRKPESTEAPRTIKDIPELKTEMPKEVFYIGIGIALFILLGGVGSITTILGLTREVAEGKDLVKQEQKEFSEYRTSEQAEDKRVRAGLLSLDAPPELTPEQEYDRMQEHCGQVPLDSEGKIITDTSLLTAEQIEHAQQCYRLSNRLGNRLYVRSKANLNRSGMELGIRGN